MSKKTVKDLTSEVQELRAQLEEAQETLNAIRRGEIDGLVVSTPKGEQIYTLSGAETPYRLLIEEMKEGALMLSDKNIILYANKGFAQIVKHPLVEIVGKNIETIVAPTHLSTLKEILYLSRSRKDVVENEIALKAKDNTLIPVHVSVALLTKNDPKTTLLIATDLTQHMEEQIKKYTINLEQEIKERKKAEEGLQASEKKANDLIKHAASGIYELDYRIPPKFRSINDAMCQILGYTREELLATNPFALLDDESRIRFRERIMKMLAGEKVDETVEFKVITKDGREIYAALNVTFTYKDGKPDGALVIAHDVTERKKAERQLEQRAKNLENLVEERTKALRDSERLAAIGATAGMVGHDIRNPLQAITSDVYLAKTDLASTPESEEKKKVLESLQEIEENVGYVNKIVADLQDFARPIAPKIEETDLEQTINLVLAHLDIPGNVTLKHFLGRDFPKLKADQAYLQRILTNLANNAIQAMPKGGKLAINAVIKDGKAIISVEDNGEGIPESVRNKLFTPLFTTKSRGQGFGLSVVKRFTEGMGGTVAFESEVGKGTKFIIELPI